MWHVYQDDSTLAFGDSRCGWHFNRGCIYERIRKNNIYFNNYEKITIEIDSVNFNCSICHSSIIELRFYPDGSVTNCKDILINPYLPLICHSCQCDIDNGTLAFPLKLFGELKELEPLPEDVDRLITEDLLSEDMKEYLDLKDISLPKPKSELLAGFQIEKDQIENEVFEAERNQLKDYEFSYDFAQERLGRLELLIEEINYLK